MPYALIAVLGIALGYAARGGGYSIHTASDWNLVIICCAAVAWLGVRHQTASALPPKRLLAAVTGALILTSLQLIPLPKPWISAISPRRAEQLANLAVSHELLSAVPQQTVQHVLGALSALLLCILVYWLAPALKSRPWAPVLPLLLIAGTEASCGLAQVAGFQYEFASGTFGNRNHFAGYLEMCVPFAVLWMAAVIRRGPAAALRTARSLALLGILALCVAAVAFSGSRMGFVATAAGLLTVIPFTLPRRVRKWIAVPVVAGGLVVFISLAPDMLIQRFAAVDDGDAYRTGMWRDAIDVIKAYPLTGVGYGAYMSGAGQFQTTAPTHYIDYAHNDYLQLTAELGIPAMLCLLTAAFCVVQLTWRNARRARTIDLRYRAIACLGAYVAIAFHSFVDFNLYIPANLMTLAWIAGIGMADVGAGRRKEFALRALQANVVQPERPADFVVQL